MAQTADLRSDSLTRGSDGARAERVLRAAALVYLVAWAVHTGDHMRRGLGVVTPEVAALGVASALVQLAVIGAVLLRLRTAALAAAIVGIVDGAGIFAVHFLPRWSAFSDAFPGAVDTGVTPFSWFAGALELVAALAFGVAGIAVLLSRRTEAA